MKNINMVNNNVNNHLNPISAEALSIIYNQSDLKSFHNFLIIYFKNQIINEIINGKIISYNSLINTGYNELHICLLDHDSKHRLIKQNLNIYDLISPNFNFYLEKFLTVENIHTFENIFNDVMNNVNNNNIDLNNIDPATIINARMKKSPIF